jgi:hypothetical protein
MGSVAYKQALVSAGLAALRNSGPASWGARNISLYVSNEKFFCFRIGV